jgi:hypothetical protein
MAQEATKLDHLHEVEHLGAARNAAGAGHRGDDQVGLAPDTRGGQELTSIARYRADFGCNHCGGVGQYSGKDRSCNRRFPGPILQPAYLQPHPRMPAKKFGFRGPVKEAKPAKEAVSEQAAKQLFDKLA